MNFMKRYITILLLILPCLLNVSIASSLLPADQAFVLSTNVNESGKVFVQWQVAPGYYLYAKRTQILLDPPSPNLIRFPQGEFKYDEEGHRDEVLTGTINVPITMDANYAQTKMTIRYQGCSKDGFCYPPMEKEVFLNSIDRTTVLIEPGSSVPLKPIWSWTLLLTDQQQIYTLLQDKHFSVLLLLFLGLGLLLAFTPCVLPMMPILGSLIVGRAAMSSAKAFRLSASYILGMSAAYAIAGLFVASLGQSLQVYLQQPGVIIFTSLIFLGLALSLFGLFELQLPNRLQQAIYRVNQQQRGGTHVRVFAMGVLSTLIVSPCVTAPLVGVLMYIAQTGDKVLGASALFMMGLGMGIPLLLMGTSAGHWLPKSGPWMQYTKQLMAFIMIAMAIWMISRLLSMEWAMLLWSLFIAGMIGSLSHHFLRCYVDSKKWRQRASFALGIASMFAVIGSTAYLPTSAGRHVFNTVHTVAELEKAINNAKSLHRPVMVDFYADWCESCVSMDKKVFNDKAVKKTLESYTLLRADLTTNAPADHALMKKYNVIAPPTILFFDINGHELLAQRIVGEVDAKLFLARIQRY